MLYLGERSDGGIVTATLRTVEYLGYVNASLDSMKQTGWETVAAIGQVVTAIKAQKMEVTVNTTNVSQFSASPTSRTKNSSDLTRNERRVVAWARSA